MSKTCGDCKWLQAMKNETLTICKNKDSNWYVRNRDTAACKHFELREDIVKLMEERGLG